MKALKFTLIALFLIICGVSTSKAQQKAGTLKGLALNVNNGETVPFANIVVKDTANNIVAGGTSNIDGLFKISPVAKGSYTVEASFLGYTKEIFNNVEIKSGKETSINVLLTEEVTLLEECVVMAEHVLIGGCTIRCFFGEDSCCFGCYAVTTIASTLSDPLFTSDSISLYPNPSSGELNIQSQVNVDFVTITNMNGQTVAEIRMDNNNEVVTNLSHLPPATYVIHFANGGKRFSKLWILAH